MIFVDGAYRSDGVAPPVFHPVPPPDAAHLQAVVQRIAERVEELLDRVGDEAPADRPDNEPLDTPIEDEFRVGTIGLAWEPARGRVVIECHDHDPDEGPPPPDAALHSVRVVLTTGQAREFVRRSGSLVAAGRPPCPFCGLPLDVTGHICPRANGYRR